MGETVLFDHTAKVAVVTAHYESILGHRDELEWMFDLNNAYSGQPLVQLGPLVAPFTEAKVLVAL